MNSGAGGGNAAPLPPCDLSRSKGKGIGRCLLVVLMIWLACGFTSLFWPMGRDQGIYAYQGRLIREGRYPFKDVWELKGPGPQYFSALAQTLFGENMWGIRVLDMLCQFVAALLMWRILRRLEEGWCAGVAASLFLLTYYNMGFWYTAQAESIALPLMMLALWLADHEPARLYLVQSTAAGFCLGLTVWLKPHFLVLAGAPILLFIARSVRGQAGAWWAVRHSLVMLIGASVGMGLLFLWAWATGAWSAMVEIMLGFNRATYSRTGRISFISQVDAIHFCLTQFFPVLTVLSAAGLVLLWRHRRYDWAGLIFMGTLSGAAIILGGKYFPYHWNIMIPWAAAFAGYAAAQSAPSDRGRRWGDACNIVSWILIFAAFVAPGWERLRDLCKVGECLMGRKSWMRYYGQSTLQVDYFFPACWEVAEYIKHITRADDYVLVWAYDPIINFLSNRRSPTRFSYPYPLVATRGNTNLRKWRTEFMEDLSGRPPAVIVVGVRDRTWATGRDSRSFLNEFGVFKGYLHSRYVLDWKNEWYEIWRRRQGLTDERK